MPPKKVVSAAGPIKPAPKTSAAMRQIDDILGESELPDGQMSQQISMGIQKKRVEELSEKFFNIDNAAA